MYIKSADDNFILKEKQRIKNERIENLNYQDDQSCGAENEKVLKK